MTKIKIEVDTDDLEIVNKLLKKFLRLLSVQELKLIKDCNISQNMVEIDAMNIEEHLSDETNQR